MINIKIIMGMYFILGRKYRKGGGATAYNTASCAALPLVAWASPHFHLRCATVKTSHTPRALYAIAPPIVGKKFIVIQLASVPVETLNQFNAM